MNKPCLFIWGCSPPKVTIPTKTRDTPIIINRGLLVRGQHQGVGWVGEANYTNQKGDCGQFQKAGCFITSSHDRFHPRWWFMWGIAPKPPGCGSKICTPKWNPDKWKLGLQSAVPWWFNVDPHPASFRLVKYYNSPREGLGERRLRHPHAQHGMPQLHRLLQPGVACLWRGAEADQEPCSFFFFCLDLQLAGRPSE